MDVKGVVLKRVVDYMKHYADSKPPEIEKPLKSANLSDVVPAWDAEFVSVDQEMLFELILVRPEARRQRRGGRRGGRGGGDVEGEEEEEEEVLARDRLGVSWWFLFSDERRRRTTWTSSRSSTSRAPRSRA